MESFCTTFNIRHFPRSFDAFPPNWFLEARKKTLGTQMRNFLHGNPEDWCVQVQIFAYAGISRTLSQLRLSQYEIVFLYATA